VQVLDLRAEDPLMAIAVVQRVGGKLNKPV
jgi:hypothetical protein